MSAPQISVVLPAYNHESFIQDAIASVLGQTYADFELIIVDDGSSDGTAAVIAGISDPRISVFHQQNAGSHAAINRGLGLARGKYLAILNSDDRYHPTRLATLLAIAEQRQAQSTFAVTGLRLITTNGAIVTDPDHHWLKMYRHILGHWEAMHRDPLKALLGHNFAISTSNFFFDRALLNQIGYFRPLRYVLDWEYILRVALQQPEALVFLPEQELLDYRLHETNTINTGAIYSRLEGIHLLESALEAQYGQAIRPTLRQIHAFRRFVRQEKGRVIQHSGEQTANLLKIEIHQGLQRLQQEEITRQETAAKLQKVESQYIELQAWSNATLQAIYQSYAWRLSAPLRWLERQTTRVGKVLRAGKRMQQQMGWRNLLVHLAKIYDRQGLQGLAATLKQRLQANNPSASTSADTAYQLWLEQEALENQALQTNTPNIIASLPKQPLFSVVTPVFNTDPALLEAMVQSVQSQYYPHWELCLCDDASDWVATQALLAQATQREPRIRLHRRATNGHIVAATNDALQLASGDYVVFLDHDDQLAPQGLLRLAQYLAEHPETDVIYSDEDKLDPQGHRVSPFFKPDWSPSLLLAQNYICHLVCVRRTLLQACGGLQLGMEGSQDYDLILRLSEHTQHIRHIPEILYHWRIHPNSTAMHAAAKPYAHEAGRKAVAEHLTRRYPKQFNDMEETPYLFVYEPRFHLPEKTLVSIIIPTKDKAELLAACVQSILELSCWPHFEILVLDNNSVEPATFAYFQKITAEDARVKVLPLPIPFNWSRLNNLGAREAQGDVLIFLNNDTVVISPDWLNRLMERALLPDVGTVGAQLLYEDGTLQHAGVVVGMGGWADHLYKGLPPAHRSGPFVSTAVTRNVLANTGACVAIAKTKFEQLGGFNEDFEICGSDVELGIRAHRQGLQNIYLASVRLYHYESKTRGTEVPAADFTQSARHYAPYRLEGDPFYNRNLSLYLLTPTPQFPQCPAHGPTS